MSEQATVDYRPLESSLEAGLAFDFFVRMLDEQFSGTFSSDALQAYREKYDRELFKCRCASGHSILMGAWAGEELVGLVIGGPPNGGVASLDWVVIAPGHQGKGLGQQLVCHCLEAYRVSGAHKVVLYTETTRGRDFYQKCGMACEGVHPRHWWGLTHYCMGYVFPDSPEALEP